MSSSHLLSDFAGSVSEAFVEILERATDPTETQECLRQQADQVNEELVRALAQRYVMNKSESWTKLVIWLRSRFKRRSNGEI